MIARAWFLTMAALLLAAASPSAPTPSTLWTRLSSETAKQVVDDLDRKDQFDTVLSRIGQGSVDWIALAPRLAPGTDAASAEGLGIALAHALPLNAAAVLRAGSTDDGPVSLKRICSVPFIETTKSYNDTYSRRVIVALAQVHDARLRAKRDQCRAILTTP